MRSRLPSAIVAATVLAACWTSPDPYWFGPARSPRGVGVTAAAGSGPRLSGELIAVEDSSVVVLAANRRLVRIHYDILDYLALSNDLGTVIVQKRPTIGASERELLSGWSRYPYGLSERARAVLLADTRQDTLDVVRWPRGREEK